MRNALRQRLEGMSRALAPTVTWSELPATDISLFDADDSALVFGAAHDVTMRIWQVGVNLVVDVSGSDLEVEMPMRGRPLELVLGQFDRSPVHEVTSELWPPYASWRWIDLGGGVALTYVGRLTTMDRLARRLPWYREERRTLGGEGRRGLEDREA